VTEQYLRPTINDEADAASLTIASYDFRETPDLVPTGTTGTMQGLQIPVDSQLVRLAVGSVFGPGAGESVIVRLYRIRPSTNPAGFAYILLNDPFVFDASSFPGFGAQLDISSTIRPNRTVLKDEFLAVSWVHAGPQAMRPFNMNWNFAPANSVTLFASEPAPDTVVYTDVFG
jgi:hypothetical protein